MTSYLQTPNFTRISEAGHENHAVLYHLQVGRDEMNEY